MTNVLEIKENLGRFYGTEQYWKHGLFSGLTLNLTDGCNYLREAASCYWLFDAICSYQRQCMKDESLRDIQFWTLKVNLPKRRAVLTCERDTDDVAITQEIPFTDFPLEEIKIWVENGVCMLPQER